MTPDKRYVKFPTAFIDFICSAKFPECQSKMLLAAVRNCHGYHQPDRCFDLLSLKRWLGWDRRAVFRTAGELLQRKMFFRETNGEYRLNNDAGAWLQDWTRSGADPAVDNPVDKSVDNSQGCLPLDDKVSSHGMTSVIPTEQLSTGQAVSKLFEEMKSNSPPPKENPQAPPAQVFDASEFLKKSLKKILKKKENSEPDPDVLKNDSERKKKIEVYKCMIRSGRWSDGELIELARTSSAAQLEAVFYGGQVLRNTG